MNYYNNNKNDIEYDYEKLRYDMEMFLGTASFTLDIEFVLIDVARIKYASNEELIKYANQYHFNLNNYIIKKYNN